MKITLLTIILIFFGITANAQNFKGEWMGIGNQIDGQNWQIVLSFKNKHNITISYPSLGCSGNWTLQKSIDSVHIFKEHITEGLQKCDQGCEIHLQKISKKRLKVIYYLRSYNPINPIAEGLLLRKNRKMK